MSSNKALSSGVITVQADSGLEIDFEDADKTTYIDLWKYLDEDSFCFEPATSVDGRNIYFPTTGTFGADDTESMTFREGTVNDVNSKYISVDFELKNTSTTKPANVFLSNNSSFLISDSKGNVNGKALRLAFYNNDGRSGNVASDMTKFNAASTGTGAGGSTDSEDMFTVYFYRDKSWGLSTTPKAYLYDSTRPEGDENPQTDTYTSDLLDENEDEKTEEWAINSGVFKSWPGADCTYISGDLFSYTFSNPKKTVVIEDENGKTIETYTASTQRKYDTIMFVKDDNTKTASMTIQNGRVYNSASQVNDIAFNTVYFLNPAGWGTPYCCAENSEDHSYYGQRDDNSNYAMTKVSTGVYSYTLPTAFDRIMFINGSDSSQESEEVEIVNGQLYYFPDTTFTGLPEKTIKTLSGFSSHNIYFYNTKGWDQPYAYVNALPNSDYEYSIPMISLTGNFYYCSVSTPFLYDVLSADNSAVGTSTVSQLAAENCYVYFANAKNKSDITERTRTFVNDGSAEADRSYCRSNYVYRPEDYSNTTDGVKYYSFSFSDYTDVTDNDSDSSSYAVISPGVSAGFQRAANPVKSIDTSTGVAQAIIPAFAKSFDDFIVGSDQPVFTIPVATTVNMSMIIWLEGTDDHCTGENYSGRDISLYLEFSTVLSGDDSGDVYTYNFIDETNEHWACDVVTNPSTGVQTSPVMQLYDATLDRGYLMTPSAYIGYKDYNGVTKNKVHVWSCVAPRSLANNTSGNIEFRRVNPYNESEVWNYWDAGNLSEYKTFALDKQTISFTALGESTPDPRGYTSAEFTLPAKACGGLWGSFDVSKFYVYDGRQDYNITTRYNNDQSTDSELTIRYTYQYSASKSVDLEYKSSQSNRFYTFAVPYAFYTQRPSVTINNYWNIKDSLNSYKNTSMKRHQQWSPGMVGGCFYAIDGITGDMKNNYWGSDAIYIQIRQSVCSNLNDNDNFYQVEFYGEDADKDNAADYVYYAYLYRNDAFKGGSSDIYGSFVAIVPSGLKYTECEFQRCDYANHSTVTKFTDTRFSLSQVRLNEGTAKEMLYNIVAPSGSSSSDTDQRIITLDWDWKQFYYHASNWGDNYKQPNVWYWKDGMGAEDKPSEWIKNYSNNAIYRCFARSDCTAYFYFPNAQIHYSVNIDPIDGVTYYPKGTSDNGTKVDIGAENNGKPGYADLYGNYNGAGGIADQLFQKIYTSRYENENYPEYTAKTSRPNS